MRREDEKRREEFSVSALEVFVEIRNYFFNFPSTRSSTGVLRKGQEDRNRLIKEIRRQVPCERNSWWLFS